MHFLRLNRSVVSSLVGVQRNYPGPSKQTQRYLRSRSSGTGVTVAESAAKKNDCRVTFSRFLQTLLLSWHFHARKEGQLGPEPHWGGVLKSRDTRK
ncbi:hypothetical protein GN956_G22869 [Arapaima gigas]